MVSFIGIVIMVACGFLVWQDYIEAEMREIKYQQEIEACNRRIEECRRLQELINYDGDDWIRKWEDYMMKYSSYGCYPV